MTQRCSRFQFVSAVFCFPLRSFLARLGIRYDFASIINAYYREKFDNIPAAQKAVILPHCLIGDKCPARFSKEEGILCSKCKKCGCGEVRILTEEQGWQFYISPSTGFTKRLVKRKTIRAAVGAACTFEIEKGIRSTPVGTKGVHLQQEKVIPQMILTARYDCLNNDIDWEQLKRIIRGKRSAA
ncbi:MAG: hypothetical protein CVU52_03275 [Deltaproteobacteria bacterium HGW-Deltaproteobacteria-10]|nr:MAG: hypothetical protein CVU52_03275 [Deltaproteobacteria bacterium HGW-Deltaproteobacteria-10]